MLLLNLGRAVIVSAIFFVLLGLAYPLAETAIGQSLFSHQANGSLTDNGSTLIGQKWQGPQWFQGRPDGFDPAVTGGSNLGPRSQKLLDTYHERIDDLQKQGITPTPDLIAASGSGIDPHVSPAAAYAQVDTIAGARHLDPSRVRDLVTAHVQGRQFGFLGAAHVNVLELNEGAQCPQMMTATATGRFRVYLGMAAGVGKTYAMLDEGHRVAASGCDVVVGLVTTHDRPETEKQLRGLEVVPAKIVHYHGARFEEMDLDAILVRRPDVALIDELAHTNIPGASHNEKRWEDVLDLLDADINVITTVNVQHIGSLADIVEQLSGISVPERVPDAVLRQADEIELVDSSPELLRHRMLNGNIYPADRVQRALRGFFETENLSSLRELTLRFLAGEKRETCSRSCTGPGRIWPDSPPNASSSA